MNIKYCKTCPYFFNSIENKVLYLYCIKKELDWNNFINHNMGFISHQDHSYETYNRYMKNPPDNCPYILEHILSKKKEKKQSIKELKQQHFTVKN